MLATSSARPGVKSWSGDAAAPMGATRRTWTYYQHSGGGGEDGGWMDTVRGARWGAREGEHKDTHGRHERARWGERRNAAAARLMIGRESESPSRRRLQVSAGHLRRESAAQAGHCHIIHGTALSLSNCQCLPRQCLSYIHGTASATANGSGKSSDGNTLWAFELPPQRRPARLKRLLRLG